jgi:predicted DNA-binding protein
MSESKKWNSVKISAEYFEPLREFSDLTGRSVSHHIHEALENYMEDVFPLYLDQVEKVRTEIQASRERFRLKATDRFREKLDRLRGISLGKRTSTP